MAELNPNAVTGLGSNLNTKEIIGRFIEIEKRQVAPVENRQKVKNVELESWNAVKTELEKLEGVTKALNDQNIWEAKRVESSEPTIISPKATKAAKPGKTNIAVDSVALAHQITSQGFKSSNIDVGTGSIRLQIGEDEDRTPVNIRISKNNNTLDGIKDAINDSGADVEAFVIKTGSAEKPYQLLLTSKDIGVQGRILIEVKLEGGEVDPPSYESSFDETANWVGIGANEPASTSRGFGSSTPITGVTGDYYGEEDIQLKFTVATAGTVNSERGVEINWTDTLGRSGTLKMNKFNYVPGSPVEVADGLYLQISDGEVVSGDSFTVDAYAEKSELLWWLTDDERLPVIEQPSDWASKATAGGLKLTGKYDGEDDQTVVFRVEGSGQVGGPKPLTLHYEFTDTGEKGQVNIGHPYLSEEATGALENAVAFDSLDDEELFYMDFKTQGGNPRKLSIGHGLSVEIPPVILVDGDTIEADVIAKVPDSFWWKPEDLRGYDGKVDQDLQWEPFIDDDGNVTRASVKDGLLGFGRQVSTASIKVSGKYTEDIARTYTFKATKQGSIGITRLLTVEWEDDAGNAGTVDFGEGYKAGDPIPFNAGLEISLDRGRLVEGDNFTFDTHTSTVQRPQDCVMRLGASDLGGGVEITRPSNTIKDVVKGVELEILSTSEKPITITVTGDTEKAGDLIRDFVDAYNTFSGTVQELSKFDQSSQKGGPLLGDRNVTQIYNRIAEIATSAVRGLPSVNNMLFSLGLRINDKGNMLLDEGKLTEKISSDFKDVANVFRTNGVSDNPAVTFVGLTNKTKASPNGFSVDIEKAATRGVLTGSRAPEVIRIDGSNDEIIVLANGRRSDPLELRQDTYNVASLAREIQSKLADDKRLGSRRIRVEEDEGRLKITNGSYGKSSTIGVEPGKDKDIAAFGLVNVDTVDGTDVTGKIEGIPASGRGQLLVGEPGSDAEGLRIFVTMTEEQLKAGADAKITLTKGVGSQLNEQLSRYNDPVDGDVKKITTDIGDQIKNYDSQIKSLNERIEKKHEALQMKFAKLEGTLGRLKTQQSYLGQQLSALGGGGGGGAKK